MQDSHNDEMVGMFRAWGECGESWREILGRGGWEER